MGNGTQAFAVAAEQPEKANPLKHVEDAIEQNDNNFDGIINNTPTPTADELEAKARSGEQISLAEYAAALKLSALRGLTCDLIREKELIYRNVKKGAKLIQHLQTWVLPLIFYGNKVTGS